MKLDSFRLNVRKIVCNIIILQLCLFVAGCSGITPEQYRNTREEGPEKGLFSGPDGEFVLIGPAEGELPTEIEEEPKTTP